MKQSVGNILKTILLLWAVIVWTVPLHAQKVNSLNKELSFEGDYIRITSYNVCYTKLLRYALNPSLKIASVCTVTTQLVRR